jgi:hypothetical protein
VTCRRANPLLLKFYQKTVFIARGQATKKQENPCKIQKFSCAWVDFFLLHGGILNLQASMRASAPAAT